MALSIKNTAVIEARYSQWFFHGLTRAGKTTAAATFPSPIFIVPKGEGSHIALSGRKFDYLEVEGPVEMDEALGLLEGREHKAKKLAQQGKEDEAIEAFPWETVVVESLTHYADAIVEEYTRGGATMMDKRTWGQLSGHLRSVRARLGRLPVHVVFIALSKTLTNDKQEVLSIEPSFPGSMNEKLPSACDVVVYMERRAGKPRDSFTAHFNKCGKAVAGSRYDALTQMGSMSPFDFAKVEQALGW